MNTLTPVEIATRTYYWKPMAAFFGNLEIGMYKKSGVRLAGPILDLGCGDGAVAQMLNNIGVINNQVYGVDVSYDELKKARKTKGHLALLQADVNQLPFKDEEFSSIICNSVLGSIPGNVARSLREVNRILKPGGLFVATVPTDKYIDAIVLPELLGKISPRLRAWYVEKLNARLPHFNAYSADKWQALFKESGLKIISEEKFFSSKQGMIWNIFSLHIFRVFGLLKLIKYPPLVNVMSNTWMKVFGRLGAMSKRRKSDFGYLYIVAQK